MPGRFSLTPQTLTSDPFCEDAYCGDPPPPPEPPFDPDIYSYARWVGTINYASFDGNASTPYFVETPLFTGAWVALGTVGGVKDVLALRNTETTQILPTGILSWRASQVFTFNPASYPTNRYTSPFTLIKYNPNAGVTPIANPTLVTPGGVGSGAFWGFSPPTSGGLTTLAGTFYRVVETNERLATYSGVYQFSNNASTVLATWVGTGVTPPVVEPPPSTESFEYTAPEATELPTAPGIPIYFQPQATPSYRFSLAASPLAGDPFCDDGFCGDAAPTISVTVTPSSVVEDEGLPLVFTFELSSPLGFGTTVNYTMSGTATNGVDYTGSAITGTRTIAAGELTAAVTITPVPDAIIEGTQTVTVTINSAISNGVPLGVTTAATTGDITEFDPYAYAYYRIRQPGGATTGWHVVSPSSPPGLSTSALMGTATCPSCFPILLSPTPSTFTAWCADQRSSIAGPYAANATDYARIVTAFGLVLYSSNWNYNVSPGGVNCITAPVCGSGKGGNRATWEFTNNNVTSIVLATWIGTPSDYVDLTL